jgi:hypothetical protein
MLNAEGDQHQDGADKERRVQAKAQPLLKEREIDELDLPRPDRRFGGKQRRQNVAGGNAATDGEHWCPGEPVTPHRQRRDEL